MVSAAFSLVMMCTVFFFYDVKSLRLQKQEQMLALSEVLASSLKNSLKFHDSYSGLEYLATLKHQRDVESAVIYDKDGGVFASFTRDGDNPLPAREAGVEAMYFTNEHFIVAKPIRNGDDVAGQLVVMSSLQDVHDRLRFIVLMGTGLLSLSLLLVGAMALWLQRYVTSPIRHLVFTMHRVRDSRDYRGRAQKWSNDELGQLVDSFNEMLETVKKRDDALVNHKSILEETVQKLYAAVAGGEGSCGGWWAGEE